MHCAECRDVLEELASSSVLPSEQDTVGRFREYAEAVLAKTSGVLCYRKSGRPVFLPGESKHLRPRARRAIEAYQSGMRLAQRDASRSHRSQGPAAAQMGFLNGLVEPGLKGMPASVRAWGFI